MTLKADVWLLEPSTIGMDGITGDMTISTELSGASF